MIERRASGLVLTRSAYLIAAAAAEVASREKHYPAMIAAGQIERHDADADLAAWRTIALLYAQGDAGEGFCWQVLELATSRALIRRCEACSAKPSDAQLIERRDAVQSIHDCITWHRWYWTDPRGPAPAMPAAPVREAA